MKMIKKATTALVSVAAVVAMTACSSDSDTPFVSGELATGGFVKAVAETGVQGIIIPFNSSAARTQEVITAANITGSGYIESITYQAYWAEVDTACSDITFKMGHTSLSTLGTTFALNVEEGKGTHQTVFTGALNIPAAANPGDPVTVVLDTPFYYNGVDNLVLDVESAGCDNTFDTNTDNTVPANSMLYSLTAGAADGIQAAYTHNLAFNFEGGDDKINLDGTATGFFFPYSVNPTAQKTQMLYTSSEINGSGPITGFAYKVGQTTTVDQEQTITVRMGHTTKTAIAGGDTFADNFTNSVEVIKDANFTIPANIAVGDYVWLPTTGSFNYNGTDNLIVEVDVTAAAATEEFNPAANTVDVTGRRICGASGGTVADGSCSSDALYIAKFRFNGAPMDVITAGDTGSFYITPFYGSAAVRTQYLYSAHSLGTGGAITEVSFRLENDSSASDYAGAEITIGHTSNTVISATYADNIDDGKAVFSGTLSVPAGLKAGDWVTFPVSKFTYDPTKNLVVEISNDAGTVDNFIRGTQTDVPGASGWTVGYKGDEIGINSGPGQVDLRLNISK